jgi:hypothetical protein
MRENRREGEQRMKLTRIQEESALFDERHAASAALRDTNRQNADSRRRCSKDSAAASGAGAEAHRARS